MNIAFDFTAPWRLAWLPLAVLPLLPRRGDRLAFPWLAWLPDDRVGRWVAVIGQGCAVLAILGIIVGLAGPGHASRQVLRTGSGAQVLILMDRSASMDEPMNSKGVQVSAGDSKNKVARAALTGFVTRRPHDRFAFMMFGSSPVLAMPFTYDHDAIVAAIAGTAVERGMPDTELGRGLTAAIDAFDGRISSGRRAIILVSDGGARLDARAMRLVADGLKRNRIALYFIYLRSGIYSPDLNAPTAATEISAESALHRYFLSLQTPYRLFQAGSAKAMTDAVTEIDRQQDVVTSFVEQVPRRDVSAYCFALALSGCLLLLVLRLLQVRAWS